MEEHVADILSPKGGCDVPGNESTSEGVFKQSAITEQTLRHIVNYVFNLPK